MQRGPLLGGGQINREYSTAAGFRFHGKITVVLRGRRRRLLAHSLDVCRQANEYYVFFKPNGPYPTAPSFACRPWRRHASF